MFFVRLPQFQRGYDQRDATLLSAGSRRVFLSLLEQLQPWAVTRIASKSGGAKPISERKENEYLVVSFDYCLLDFSPGIHFAQIGDFNVNER